MKLLPCPFCGSSATALRGEVSCDSCGCEVKRGTTADAIEDWNRRPASHPTPVQGEALPVVAKVVDTDITGARIVRVMRPVDIGTQLTDHAQATAEIARLTEENRKLRVGALQNKICMNASVEERDRITVDNNTLRTQLSDATGQVGKLTQAWNAACAFIDSHAGDPDIIEEMCRTYAAFMDIRAALNSSAPK
jgi:hypothetical protein